MNYRCEECGGTFDTPHREYEVLDSRFDYGETGHYISVCPYCGCAAFKESVGECVECNEDVFEGEEYVRFGKSVLCKKCCDQLFPID